MPRMTIPFIPRIGIIGGSGLGNALLAAKAGDTQAQTVDLDTPFGKPSAPVATWSRRARGGPCCTS